MMTGNDIIRLCGGGIGSNTDTQFQLTSLTVGQVHLQDMLWCVVLPYVVEFRVHIVGIEQTIWNINSTVILPAAAP